MVAVGGASTHASLRARRSLLKLAALSLCVCVCVCVDGHSADIANFTLHVFTDTQWSVTGRGSYRNRSCRRFPRSLWVTGVCIWRTAGYLHQWTLTTAAAAWVSLQKYVTLPQEERNCKRLAIILTYFVIRCDYLTLLNNSEQADNVSSKWSIKLYLIWKTAWYLTLVYSSIISQFA